MTSSLHCPFAPFWSFVPHLYCIHFCFRIPTFNSPINVLLSFQFSLHDWPLIFHLLAPISSYLRAFFAYSNVEPTTWLPLPIIVLIIIRIASPLLTFVLGCVYEYVCVCKSSLQNDKDFVFFIPQFTFSALERQFLAHSKNLINTFLIQYEHCFVFFPNIG